MTEQDKDILVGKMLDSPSSLTDEELSKILNDDELRDIYEASSAVKGAYMSLSEIEVENEWRGFRRRILPKPSPLRWMVKIAAIFLGIVLLSGILVKIVDYGLTQDDKPFVTDAGQSMVNNPSGGIDVDIDLSDTKERVDDMSEIETTTPVYVSATSGRLKSTAGKVEVEEDIDIDGYLRSQQAEIDYEIALLNAEIYLDERDAMQEFVGYMNADNINEAETKIIIQ